MNLNTYLDSSVQRFPGKAAIVFRDIVLTYREFHERVCRLASAMKRFSLRPGDRVAVLSTNSSYYLEIVFACARLGLCIDMLNYRLSCSLTAELIDDARCSLLFISDTCKEALPAIIEQVSQPVTIIEIGDDYEELLASGNTSCQPAEIADDDVIFNLYTSGTTGKPKAVMLSNKNIISQALVCIAETNWGADETYLHVLPQFHIAGQGTYNTLFLGGTLVILDRFDAKAYADLLEKHSVTRIGLTPHLIDCLVKDESFEKSRCPDLRTVIYAGSSMPREILERSMRELECDLYAYYGMTEMSSVIGILKPKDHTWVLSHPDLPCVPVGRVSMGTLIRVIDDEGKECAMGQPGEFIASGDGVMQGYTDLALTEKALKDGWYYTGDIGYYDEHRYFYLVDRKDDLFVCGGENIYPSEIEQTIQSSSNAIQDVVVVGVPDETWGHSIHAVIVADESEIDADAIVDYCKTRLASYKKPRKIHFWKELPRNANNKILRKKVLEKLL